MHRNNGVIRRMRHAAAMLSRGPRDMLLGFALLCGLLAAAHGAPYYVDLNATGTPENGSTWSQAFRTITNATKNIASGGEFWVARGTYLSPLAAGMDIKANVFYGGFTNGMTDLSQRDWNAYRVICDGGGLYRALQKSSTGSATLDGFFVQNGTNTQGGGFNIGLAGFVTVRNCTFSNNVATTSGGGAIFSSSAGTNTFSNCWFIANASWASSGGALRMSGGGNTNTYMSCWFIGNQAPSNSTSGGAMYDAGGYLSYSNCVFSNNWSGNVGGAIRAPAVQVQVIGCQFSGNYSTNSTGGAIYASSSGAVLLSNCVFTANKTLAAKDGGAFADNGGGVAVTITGSSFQNNASGASGGAVSSGASTLTVFNSDFASNTATSAGGAINHTLAANGGATRVQNCSFAGNLANAASGTTGGGAIMENPSTSYQSVLAITNCTFLSNSCAYVTTPANGVGGAIRAGASSSSTVLVSVANCIFWGNTISGSGSNITFGTVSPLSLAYSDISTNGNALSGTIRNFGARITNTDPLFASATLPFDVHLKSTGGRWNPATSQWVKDSVSSPCLNAGDPASDYALEPDYPTGHIELGRYGNTAQASLSPGIVARLFAIFLR